MWSLERVEVVARDSSGEICRGLTKELGSYGYDKVIFGLGASVKVEAAIASENGMKPGVGIRGLLPVGHLSSWAFQKATPETGDGVCLTESGA